MYCVRNKCVHLSDFETESLFQIARFVIMWASFSKHATLTYWDCIWAAVSLETISHLLFSFRKHRVIKRALPLCMETWDSGIYKLVSPYFFSFLCDGFIFSFCRSRTLASSRRCKRGLWEDCGVVSILLVQFTNSKEKKRIFPSSVTMKHIQDKPGLDLPLSLD